MKLIAMLTGGIVLLALSACGGGGGGMVRSVPETPSVAAPVEEPAPVERSRVEPEPAPVPEPVESSRVEPEPEPEPAPAPVQAPAVEPPDPATILQSHDRLALLPDLQAAEVDTAMFLLANTPYQPAASATGGGSGLTARSAGAPAPAAELSATERTAAYSADHAYITAVGVEDVAQVNPEVVTRTQYRGGGSCDPARGECVVKHPAPARHCYLRTWCDNSFYLRTPIEDMPFVGEALRKGSSEGVRTRGGVGLRYFNSGNASVPWDGGWKEDGATNTWSGYGAWLDWGGFGIVMLAHNHKWDLYDSAWYYGIAGGDKTGAAPEVTGTWRGAAVAMPQDLNVIADGSATLTVSLGANPTFDARFGDWKGYTLDDGKMGAPTDVSMSTINVTDMPIEADGTFRLYSYRREGDFIDVNRDRGGFDDWLGIVGAFYGPAGQEAAGTFTYDKLLDTTDRTSWGGRIHGAFGVRRVDEPEQESAP